MIRKLAFLCLLLCLIEMAAGSCYCPYIYEPVCGSDGVTYPNKYCMLCENPCLTVKYEGPCR